MAASYSENATQERTLFRILGPIEVADDNGPIHVPLGRQQVILAALLLDANQVVGIDQLIDLVWDLRPPATARTQIQVCVSSLRHVLSGAGHGAPIVTTPPGYLLRVDQDQLDLHVFERKVAAAENATHEGRLAEGAALLRDALTLWRGEALGGGVASRQLRADAVRLDEKRMTTLENCIGLELRIGRHHELIAELTGLVDEHPLRERLRGQLMLALYRSGRQADALAVYRDGREALVDQLGLEPGEELRKLEGAILSGAGPAASVTSGRTETIEVDSPAARTVRPRQLPADITDFTGRDELVDHILTTIGDHDDDAAVPIVSLTGKPGAGKSALAVHVAHRLAHRFPDGQLYADLRGTRSRPADPSVVLARHLRALGVPGAAVPDDLAERAEMFRSVVADRRVLVVLDDAADEAQVLPLLPGGGRCAVIVTSRPPLTGLPGVRACDVDVLDVDHALALLGEVIGRHRPAAEPEAARRLVRFVGCLPLALRVVAARLAARPHWTLQWMLRVLVDAGSRLDELAHGGLAVRASLAPTYLGLDERARRLVRLLSLAEQDAFPAWTAAALLDDDPACCTTVLEQLVDARMIDVVESEGSPRYRFHRLIRLYAREQLEHTESPAERDAALRRLVGGWQALCDAAHRRLYGGDYTLVHGTGERWHLSPVHVEGLLADPLRWLTTERAALCSVVTQAADANLDESCWDLAVTLVTLFEARSDFDGWRRTHDVALAATRRSGNTRGTAAVLCSLGSLYLSLRRLADAREALLAALARFEELHDVHGAALTHRSLGLLAYVNDRPAEAAEHYERSLSGFRQVGDRIGESYVLGRIAQLSIGRSEYDTATAQLEQALAICRDVGNARLEAQLLYRMGRVLLLCKEYQRAEEVLSDVLAKVRWTGDALGESFALHSLGIVRARLQDLPAAAGMLTQAMELRDDVADRFGAGRVRLDLARLRAELDDIPAAVGLARQALRTFQEHHVPEWVRKARAVLEDIVLGDPLAAPE